VAWASATLQIYHTFYSPSKRVSLLNHVADIRLLTGIAFAGHTGGTVIKSYQWNKLRNFALVMHQGSRGHNPVKRSFVPDWLAITFLLLGLVAIVLVVGLMTD
jgi:hypothetical protein